MGTELIIVRHGEPAQGGVADPGLSELGLRQAEAVASYLTPEPVAALYCSPLLRATASAGPLSAALDLPVQIEDRVAEFDQGQIYYSEKHAAEMGAEVAMAKLAQMKSPEFRGRAVDGFTAIAEANPDASVAVVCHGGVLSAMVSTAVYNAEVVFLPEYSSVTRVRYDGGLWSLRSYNECHWLRDLA